LACSFQVHAGRVVLLYILTIYMFLRKRRFVPRDGDLIKTVETY
jgi:hypothetical protein